MGVEKMLKGYILKQRMVDCYDKEGNTINTKGRQTMGDYYYDKQGELIGSGDDIIAGLEAEIDKLKKQVSKYRRITDIRYREIANARFDEIIRLQKENDSLTAQLSTIAETKK